MIFSMTGFASQEREIACGVLVLELRAVNHRYLELQLKLDDNLRSFEPLLREMISARIGRGKVECRMSLMPKSATNKAQELDSNALEQLAQMSSAVQRHFPSSRELSVADILRWPGVLKNENIDAESLEGEIRSSLDQALSDMADSRAREGAKLRDIILQRLGDMEQQLQVVKPLLPAQIKAYQERLAAKLQEAIKTVDDERLRQELVMFAQRVDVDEELGRLEAHISEVRRILDAKAPAGKRLDFLMQELNREANTLGSKSVSTEVTQVSMSLKVLIEQMREQIQNIE